MVRFSSVHQSPLLQIARWRCAGHSRRLGPSVPSRGHTFAFVTEGLFRRHLGPAEVLAAPGDAIFFPRQSEYRTSHPCDGGDRGIGVRVEPETFEEILDRAGLDGKDSQLLVSRRALLPTHSVLSLRKLVAALEKGEERSLEVDETALLLVGEVVHRMLRSKEGGARRDSTRRARRRAVDRVIEVVHARFHEKLGLQEIAREAACSPFHLCRIFSEETGTTIHRYLNRQRLLAALEKLGSEENLAQLAAQLGFASHSHLTMAFKQELGRPPTRL